jgi:endonuclease V-like protein UPF0215 family
MTTGLLTSSKNLNRLFNKCANKNKNDIAFQNYITYRNKYNSLKRKAKISYFHNKINEYKNDGNKMWKVINELTGKCRNKQSSLNYINIEGIKTYNKELIANHFCIFFSTIGDALATKITKPKRNYTEYLNEQFNHSIYLFPTDQNEIEKIISKLKNKGSFGNDKISNKIVKLLKHQISIPLTIIFNKCLVEGIFPERMKIAHVFPIYKSKSSHEVNNYRPISLLTSISKLLEKIIHKRIFNFLENNELFNDLQFGFRPKRSTVDTITLFLGNLLQSIEDGNYNMGIFIDLSKAFDTINHNILLDKLYRLGIRGTANNFSQKLLKS